MRVFGLFGDNRFAILASCLMLWTFCHMSFDLFPEALEATPKIIALNEAKVANLLMILDL